MPSVRPLLGRETLSEYERIVGRAIMGETTPEAAAQQAALLDAVQQQMVCPTCGRVLDRAKAVLVEGGSRSAVVCGICWDAWSEALDKAGRPWRKAVTVTDGRALTW